MLVLHTRAGQICEPPENSGAPRFVGRCLIDPLKPSEEEIAFVERATGLKLPFRGSEIESSRLRSGRGRSIRRAAGTAPPATIRRPPPSALS
jgi:hypothetical protein